MYWNSDLQIPKKLKQVTLWIHGEGQVIASLFLNLQNRNYTGMEEPLEVLNQSAPFIALKREHPDELRFYNMDSIVWVEYHDENPPPAAGIEPLYCRLHMTDGSHIEGSVRRALSPYNSRLSDYLNVDDERFTELRVEAGNVRLVNKAYVACVTPIHGDDSSDAKCRPDGLEASEKFF